MDVQIKVWAPEEIRDLFEISDGLDPNDVWVDISEDDYGKWLFIQEEYRKMQRQIKKLWKKGEFRFGHQKNNKL